MVSLSVWWAKVESICVSWGTGAVPWGWYWLWWWGRGANTAQKQLCVRAPRAWLVMLMKSLVKKNSWKNPQKKTLWSLEVIWVGRWWCRAAHVSMQEFSGPCNPSLCELNSNQLTCHVAGSGAPLGWVIASAAACPLPLTSPQGQKVRQRPALPLLSI